MVLRICAFSCATDAQLAQLPGATVMLLSLLAGEGFGEDGVLLSEGETAVVLVIDVVELADAGAFADIAIGACTRREFCAGEIAD
jgi:hypothetical protein